MSETITKNTFPHHDGDVDTDALRQHLEERPELYPGALGEAARMMVDEVADLDVPQIDTITEDLDLLSSTSEVLDTAGWKRLIVETPSEGIKVIFKGRFDIPAVDDLPVRSSEISIRPLYEDEARGFGGGIRSEQQIAYAGARGSDPRQVSGRDGVSQILDRAMEDSKGREILLVCDETPQGFRALFQAIRKNSGDTKLSETARALADAEYDGVQETSKETQVLFDEISLELAAALMDEDLTPHEALILVFKSNIGTEESRTRHHDKISKLISEKLKSDRIGEDDPESYERRKASLIEAFNDPERMDYWVHRDLGVLRPGDRILTGGSYVDYPRFTTHGCLNVAIDIERNVFGSGGHGKSEDSGTTTVASRMGEFVELNGMPENIESSDTYFVNHEGLVMPENTLFVTTSPDSPPEDLSFSEIWLPKEIKDEDFENGNVEKIINHIKNSVFMSSIPESERESISIEIIYAIRGVDQSPRTNLLASRILRELSINEIAASLGLSGDEGRDAANLEYSMREFGISSEMKQGILIGGVPFGDIYDRAMQEAALGAYIKLTSRFDIKKTDSEIFESVGSTIAIPGVLNEIMLNEDGARLILAALETSPMFIGKSPEKQELFRANLLKFLEGLKQLKEYDVETERSRSLFNQVDSLIEGLVVQENQGVVNDWQLNGLKADKRRELARQASSSHLGGRKDFNEHVAIMSISEGGDEAEITRRYEEILAKSKAKAEGQIRSEELRIWLKNNLIDQVELSAVSIENAEKAKAEARGLRRADYLQTWLVNTFISKQRGKSTPKLETMGRGLDWDAPGQTEIIKKDAELAEQFGLSKTRHADSNSGTILENSVYVALGEVKRAIRYNPENADYADLIRSIRSLPLGLVAKYIKAGLISFDQTEKKVEETSHRRLL